MRRNARLMQDRELPARETTIKLLVTKHYRLPRRPTCLWPSFEGQGIHLVVSQWLYGFLKSRGRKPVSLLIQRHEGAFTIQIICLRYLPHVPPLLPFTPAAPLLENQTKTNWAAHGNEMLSPGTHSTRASKLPRMDDQWKALSLLMTLVMALARRVRLTTPPHRPPRACSASWIELTGVFTRVFALHQTRGSRGCLQFSMVRACNFLCKCACESDRFYHTLFPQVFRRQAACGGL